jgi:anti-sigma factor RsiW
MDCNQVQEMVAQCESLGPAERAHVAACAACSAVAESWGQLEALLRDDPAVTVPDGFADRVMASIAEQPRPAARWFERRWVQYGMVQVGALVSLFNLFRFVLRLLVPSLSLGGTP